MRATSRFLQKFDVTSKFTTKNKEPEDINCTFCPSGLFMGSTSLSCRFQWPRRLRRKSVAARFWDCGFKSHRGNRYLFVVTVVCCQEKVSATNWSLVQRSPTDCGVLLYVCDLETSWMTRTWPSGGCQLQKQTNFSLMTNADYFHIQH